MPFFNSVIKSQTITPAVSTEFCPNTEITFTVSLPGATSNIFVFPIAVNDIPFVTASAYNIVQPSGSITNTVFNFKGKFDDRNNKQTFQVNYKDGGGFDKIAKFTFSKIKSLYYFYTPNPAAANQTIISPNITTITAPRCQITNTAISFTNVVYGNSYESPSITYGVVTNYEYLLPAGWILGSSTSNGTSWIPGGNNVTVTSDLSNGIGSGIRIRPTNTACGTGLATGQEVFISISRPAPTLYITGGSDILCSSNATFNIIGMPAGSTVQWTLNSNLSANIPANSTSPTVTVTPTATSGNVILTATVTHCSFTYTVQKLIRVGTYSTTDYNITQYPSSVCLNQTVQFGFPWYYFTPSSTTTYDWIWGGGLTYVSGQGTSVITLRAPSSAPTGTPWVIGRANNSCGSGPMSQAKNLVYQTNCYSPFSVAPNPSSDVIKIEVSKDPELKSLISSSEIREVELIDKMGRVRYKRKLDKGLKVTTIKVNDLPSDIYTLRIFDGQTWHSHKVSVQH